MTLQLEQTPEPATPSSAWMNLVLLFCAVLALSLAAVFIRLSERELGPNATIFNRFWIGTIVLGLGAIVRAKPDQTQQSYTRQDLWLLLLAALAFAATLLAWAWSLTQTTVANSNLLHNVTPLFTTLGGWLLLRQQFDSRFLTGMALALVGSLSIGLGDLHAAPEHAIGDLAAAGSAVFSALNLILVERLRSRFSAMTIMLWGSAIGSLVTLPIVLLTETRVFPVSWQGWLAVVALAVVCQVVGQSLQAYNLKQFSAGFVALFLLLDPVLTALFAWVLFAEQLTLLNWVAFAGVLAGIYLAKSSRAAAKTGADSGESSGEPSGEPSGESIVDVTVPDAAHCAIAAASPGLTISLTVTVPGARSRSEENLSNSR